MFLQLWEKPGNIHRKYHNNSFIPKGNYTVAVFSSLELPAP